MANKKISELQSRTPALSDLMLVGDPSSGYSYKCTVTALATIIETDIADGYVTIGTTQTISGAKTFSNNLTLTSVVNTPTDPDKFLTLNASNVVTYRTGAEVLSDIGGVGGSGTTNYLPKFSATTTLANSQIFDNGTNVGIGVGSSIIAGYLLTIGGKVKIYNQIDLDNPTTNTCNAINIQKGTSISHRGVGYIQIASFNTNRLSLFFNDNNNYQADFDGSNLTTGQRYILPNATGTLALTSDLSSYVPTSRILTINGTSYDLSANRTWSVGTVTSVAALTLGTTGTDLSSSVANGTTTPVITLNIPTASATNRGALSSTDWSTFNNKQSTITLTTTGSSGSATFVSNTLNVPTYTLAGLGGISGTGTTNYIPKFTSSSAIGNSQIQDDGTNVGIGGAPSSQKVRIYGGSIISNASYHFGFTSIGAQASMIGITAGDVLSIGQNNLNHSSTLIYGGTGTIQFSVSGSEAMRLTSTGLGIGTSSPGNKLSVTGAANIRDYLLIDNSQSYFGDNGVIGGGAADGNTLIQYYTTKNLIFKQSGTERMRLDASGNLGLGVTPSAWSGKAMQVVNSSLGDVASSLQLTYNGYFDGTNWRYLTSAAATNYYQASGSHIWRTAPSGTAGNAISFTQAMTLDASGRLGVGTTSPDRRITIGGTTSAYMSFNPTSYRNFVLGSDDVGFIVYDNLNSAYRFVINTSGNVGIGSTLPYSLLQVTSGTSMTTTGGDQASNATIEGANVAIGANFTSQLAVLSNSSIAAGIGGGIAFGSKYSGNAFAYYAAIKTGKDDATSGNYGGYLQFATRANGGNVTERMRITSGGNVGIGTTSPLNRLFVTASTAGDYAGFIENTNATNGYGLVARTAHTGTSAYAFAARAGSTDVFVVRGDGNVGIGTTNPALKLDVLSAGADAINIGAGNDFSGLRLTSDAGAWAIRTSIADALFFYDVSSSTERMRITSGGELLINTTSDAGDYKLQVNGNGYVSGNIRVAQSVNNNYISFDHAGTNTWYQRITTDNTSTFLLKNDLGGGSGTTVFKVSEAGNAEFPSGSIKTAAPSGGTAKPWKLGEAGVTLGGSNTSGVRVEIDGTVYYLVTGYLP